MKLQLIRGYPHATAVSERETPGPAVTMRHGQRLGPGPGCMDPTFFVDICHGNAGGKWREVPWRCGPFERDALEPAIYALLQSFGVAPCDIGYFAHHACAAFREMGAAAS